MDNILEASDLSFSFQGRDVISGLHFRLRRGETYALMGASGSGKSVLLKLLAGLLKPSRGSVLFEGKDIAGASRNNLRAMRVKTGFVFQDAALISNMSIYDNVALPLRYHTDLAEPEVAARVAEKMTLFEVDRQYDRTIPAMLPVGMRKRAALSRALILEPALLLMDEPAAGLGADAGRLIATGLKAYQKRVGASLLIVIGEWHPLVKGVADRMGLLEGGRIAAEATTREMEDLLAARERTAAAARRTEGDGPC